VSPLVERWLRAVPSLKESALRAAFVRSEMERRELDAFARALDDLAGRAEQADPVAREVLGATIVVLTDPALAVRVDALRSFAAQHALLALSRLLRRRTRRASERPGPGPEERKLPRGGDRALTLGERKAMARRSSRVGLDRLLRDPHPLVIRNVLMNPRITEDDVVRLSARRPAYPDVIAEIARHPEWSVSRRVRMAIVQNPGSPPEIAVPMVRLLIRPELAEVMGAADVPAIVRAAARELLERRPPVPERGRGTPQ
jgi:hypothetical protein